MEEVWWKDAVEEILIPEEQVQRKVTELADRISKDYQGRRPCWSG